MSDDKNLTPRERLARAKAKKNKKSNKNLARVSESSGFRNKDKEGGDSSSWFDSVIDQFSPGKSSYESGKEAAGAKKDENPFFGRKKKK